MTGKIDNEKPFIVYIAGPLFSVAEQEFNLLLASNLGKMIGNLQFILPQKYAKEISGKTDFNEKMFRYCINTIDDADIVLCILDGPDVDSGTSVEIGYAYTRGKPIIGIRSDFRNSEEKGVNLMVSRACSLLIWVPSNRFDTTHLTREIAIAIKQFVK